jgi:hypothetical protein
VFFGLLEQARAPLCFVEEEMARRYHSKAVPLAEEEELNFQQVIAAWSKAAKAYALCARLEEPDTANPGYRLADGDHPASLPVLHGMIVLEHFAPGANCRPVSGWNCTAITNRRKNGASLTCRCRTRWKTACRHRIAPPRTLR